MTVTVHVASICPPAKQLYMGEGLSHAAISEQLPLSVSQVRRLVESLKWKKPAAAPRESAATKPRSSTAKQAFPERREPPSEARRKAWEPLQGSTPRTMHDGPLTGCRWPVGGKGADTLFCCNRTVGAWCAEHAAIGYTVSAPRRINTEPTAIRRRAA